MKGQGAGFQSLTDGIDTTTTGGKLVFHIMGALAEFERDLIRERTKALSEGRIQHMHELLNNGKTQAEVGELLGVSANTIGRELRKIIN